MLNRDLNFAAAGSFAWIVRLLFRRCFVLSPLYPYLLYFEVLHTYRFSPCLLALCLPGHYWGSTRSLCSMCCSGSVAGPLMLRHLAGLWLSSPIVHLHPSLLLPWVPPIQLLIFFPRWHWYPLCPSPTQLTSSQLVCHTSHFHTHFWLALPWLSVWIAESVWRAASLGQIWAAGLLAARLSCLRSPLPLLLGVTLGLLLSWSTVLCYLSAESDCLSGLPIVRYFLTDPAPLLSWVFKCFLPLGHWCGQGEAGLFSAFAHCTTAALLFW